MKPAANNNHARRDQALFDRISQRYARKDQYPVSRIARSARLLQTLQTAGAQAPTNDVPAYGDLLEIGCGAGYAAEYLRGHYASYLGLDYSEELIEYARHAHTAANVRFVAIDVEQFTTTEQFQTVLAIGVLHHMDNPTNAVRKLKTFIRPGGALIVNEPHPGNLLIHVLRKIRTRIDSDYSADQRELSVEELRQIFNDADFEDVEVFAQGLFSTPFAEVMLKPADFWRPLAYLACWIDRKLEAWFPRALQIVSWNLVVRARNT